MLYRDLYRGVLVWKAVCPNRLEVPLCAADDAVIAALQEELLTSGCCCGAGRTDVDRNARRAHRGPTARVVAAVDRADRGKGCRVSQQIVRVACGD